jgi:ABC-type transport system involved in multi-copper enzyme maturation permease subunit
VLSLSVLLGFGMSGIVIAATTDAQWGGYLVFIGLSILLGLVFLSLSLCCSAVLKRRVTSLGAGIVVFFFGMIVGLVFLGYLQATGGDTMDLIMGNFENIPDWFWFDPFLSPMDGYQTASTLAFDISEVFGYRMDLPEWLSMTNIVISQLLWLFIPLILAYIFFERRDI